MGRLLPIGMACHLNHAAAPLAQAAVSGDTVGDIEIHLVDLEPEPVTFSIIKLQDANVKEFTMETSDTGRPWYQAFFVYRNIETFFGLQIPLVTEEGFLAGGAEIEGLSGEVVVGLDGANGAALHAHENGVGASDAAAHGDAAEKRAF